MPEDRHSFSAVFLFHDVLQVLHCDLLPAAPNLRAQENLKAVRDKFQESADGKIEFIVVSKMIFICVFISVCANNLLVLYLSFISMHFLCCHMVMCVF